MIIINRILVDCVGLQLDSYQYKLMADDERSILDLIKNLDLEKLRTVAEHIDLGNMIESLSHMDKAQLLNLKRTLESGAEEYNPPEIKSDFYQLYDRLSNEECELQERVRQFMEKATGALIIHT